MCGNYSSLTEQYHRTVNRKITVDATRGKPGEEQIKIANALLAQLEDWTDENGVDVRNYGLIDGLPEMRRLFASMLEVDTENVIIGSTSSLNMMFDCFTSLLLSGRWTQDKSKFICPVPGFDRHFTICEYLGIKMLNVDMTPEGPDMDEVERLSQDPDVVGIWCVPLYSNPQGYVFSDETICRLASMPVNHSEFKIFWDNAYIAHNFIGERPKQVNILNECMLCNNPNRPLLFTTFSKISIAGAGVACMGASEENLNFFRKGIAAKTLGTDKVNQLRHVRFFNDLQGVEMHMQKHAQILRPKFERAYQYLSVNLKDTDATFIVPNGGYFISIKTPQGCAKKVWQLCYDAGLVLTKAGATHPYGIDPLDTHLRLGPSCLSDIELDHALEVLCLAIKIAIEK